MSASLYLYAIVERRPSRSLGRGIARKALSVVRAGEVYVVVERAERPAATLAAVRAHDRVVRRITRVCSAVLPLRFATTASDRAALAALLLPLASSVRRGLERVRDAVQFTLRVHGRATPRPPAARGAGPGTRWLAKRIAERHVHEIDPLTEATHPFVRAVREERHAKPRAAALATVYHLVARPDVRAWRAAFRRARAALRVDVTATGPWPAYAFSELT